MSQQSRGVSVRTKFVNGKLFTEKEMIYSYELLSDKVGIVWLKDIRVKMGRKKIAHPRVRIQITKEVQRQRKDFFVEAEVAKTRLFVGEGLTV